jgi:hypothetical protein
MFYGMLGQRPQMSQRPLRDAYIGFRTTEAKKKAFEINVSKYARLREDSEEDVDQSKISRRLTDAFNKAMNDETLPVYPFRLVTAPAETPKQRRSPKKAK